MAFSATQVCVDLRSKWYILWTKLVCVDYRSNKYIFRTIINKNN